MWRPLPFLIVACSAAPPATPDLSTCAISPPASSALHTEGTEIHDDLGRLVLLRGANTGGRAKFWPYAPFDFDLSDPGRGSYEEELGTYLDRAADWGFTTLRVPFTWAAFEPLPGEDDSDWAARYDLLLDEAAARGMWTVVDFHQDIYAESLCGDGFPEWTLPGWDPEDPPELKHDCADWFWAYLSNDEVAAAYDRFWADEDGVQTDFRAMWARMIARQVDRPGVIGFEILNEPSSGSASSAAWAPATLTPFYSQMAAEMKAAAPQALVFFDTSGLDAVTASTALARPEGEDLVFAPHFYASGVFAGTEDIDPDVVEAMRAWPELGVDWDLPVMVGEFGAPWDRPGGAPSLQRHYDIMDETGLSGTCWEYSDSPELWNAEDLSIYGFETGVGAPREDMLEAVVRPYPRAVAGTDLQFSYQAETATLTVRYTPEPQGISEIVVPRWRYGGVYEVEATGACVQLDEDRLWVQADADATEVQITLRPGGG